MDIGKEEALIGRAIKEMVEDFHKTVNDDRKKWCKAHGQECKNCTIECEARGVE